jgi:hypothetical protein
MPRETPGPHQPHKDNATDVLALWRCDEASAVALVDARGAYTTTLGTLPPAAKTVIGEEAFTAVNQGARDFNGTTHFATAPGNAAAHDTFALTADGQGFTVEAWVDPDVDAANMIIVAYGGTGATDGTQANNTLMELALNSRKLRLRYEHSGGTEVVVESGSVTGAAAGALR